MRSKRRGRCRGAPLQHIPKKSRQRTKPCHGDNGHRHQRNAISTSSPVEHPGQKLQLAATPSGQSAAEDDAVRTVDRLMDRHSDGQTRDASLYELLLEQGGEPVIPPRSHRKCQDRYDRIAYMQRWGIEGFFAKLKQWRRIATRCDKLAANFLGFVKLASIMLWLK